jgi:hypothetical protein
MAPLWRLVVACDEVCSGPGAVLPLVGVFCCCLMKRRLPSPPMARAVSGALNGLACM